MTGDAVGAASHVRSHELYHRALGVLPGGVNSPVRAMRAMGREPLFIAAASGAEITDVDGNRYIDFVSSWGPMIAGHAHPAVVAAIEAAARKGTSFGAPTEAEVELAERIVERVPGAEMVRLVSSGTEAGMTALRLARATTGREIVIKFAGAYHGHVDGLLAAGGLGPGDAGDPGLTRGDRGAGGGHDRRAMERPRALRAPRSSRRAIDWRR